MSWEKREKIGSLAVGRLTKGARSWLVQIWGPQLSIFPMITPNRNGTVVIFLVRILTFDVCYVVISVQQSPAWHLVQEVLWLCQDLVFFFFHLQHQMDLDIQQLQQVFDQVESVLLFLEQSDALFYLPTIDTRNNFARIQYSMCNQAQYHMSRNNIWMLDSAHVYLSNLNICMNLDARISYVYIESVLEWLA